MAEKAKILVVDDEAVVRESYLRSLAGVSYRVRAAFDAGEAIRLMEAESFDVVLVDIRMPGMDGISLLREIKTRWPESEVVVVTGYPTLESAKEAVRLGAFNYLTKPIGPREIVEAASSAVLQKRWSLKKDYSSGSMSGGKRYEYRYPWEN
jgi:two-component system response regulator AtoC